MYQIFGDAPAIKIMDWMIEIQTYDHSLAEIAEGTHLSLPVVRRNIAPLLLNGVVVVNRIIRRDEMYVLDLQNRCTKAILEFDKQISKCCEATETEKAPATTEEDATETKEFEEIDEAHEQFVEAPPER